MYSRVLMVDDEPHVVTALARVLRRELGEGVLVEYCTSARRGLERARETSFDAVLSDYRMPGMDGLAFLQAFRELQPETSRIILSGMTDFDVLMTAINEIGITRFLQKPWDDQELGAAVREAVAATQQRRVLATPIAEVRELVQSEPGLLHVEWGPNGEVLMDKNGPEKP